MTVFNSPFNLSYGPWTNGPLPSKGGGMTYNWGQPTFTTSSYNAVRAPAGTIAQITIINGGLTSYWATSDNSDRTLAGHSFYNSFQTRTVSSDESIASADFGGGTELYQPYGMRTAPYGPTTGADNSRIVIFGVSP